MAWSCHLLYCFADLGNLLCLFASLLSLININYSQGALPVTTRALAGPENAGTDSTKLIVNKTNSTWTNAIAAIPDSNLPFCPYPVTKS